MYHLHASAAREPWMSGADAPMLIRSPATVNGPATVPAVVNRCSYCSAGCRENGKSESIKEEKRSKQGTHGNRRDGGKKKEKAQYHY